MVRFFGTFESYNDNKKVLIFDFSLREKRHPRNSCVYSAQRIGWTFLLFQLCNAKVIPLLLIGQIQNILIKSIVTYEPSEIRHIVMLKYLHVLQIVLPASWKWRKRNHGIKEPVRKGSDHSKKIGYEL